MFRYSATHPRLARILDSYVLLLIALGAECIVFDFLARRQEINPFFTLPNMISILDGSATYGVVAVGMTLVIVTGGIDLSVGSIIAFGGVVCAAIVRACSDTPWSGIALGWCGALAAGLVAGSLSGLLITRFRIPPFIATLALMSSVRGLGYILARGHSIADLPGAYTYVGRQRIGDLIGIDVVVMLAVFLLGAVLFNWTRFGRHVRAIGGNEEAARLSGINVNRVKWAVYTLCSLLAVLGGLMASSELGSGDPKLGQGDELEIIAAVVVGGTSLAGGRGSIAGTFIGLLIIAVLRGGLNWIGAETFAQQVILGMVILAAVLMDRLKA